VFGRVTIRILGEVGSGKWEVGSVKTTSMRNLVGPRPRRTRPWNVQRKPSLSHHFHHTQNHFSSRSPRSTAAENRWASFDSTCLVRAAMQPRPRLVGPGKRPRCIIDGTQRRWHKLLPSATPFMPTCCQVSVQPVRKVIMLFSIAPKSTASRGLAIRGLATISTANSSITSLSNLRKG
jgi:hypothetical protein